MDVGYVKKKIDDRGGLPWLQTVGPNMLFFYLMKIITSFGKIYPVVQSETCGWLLFSDDIGKNRKRITGFFYQKGKYPVSFFTRVEYRDPLGWFIITETDYETDSIRMKEFVNVVREKLDKGRL